MLRGCAGGFYRALHPSCERVMYGRYVRTILAATARCAVQPENTMRELTIDEVQTPAGGITALEGVGLILGLTAMAVASPVILGIGFGAAGGLLIAHVLAQ